MSDEKRYTETDVVVRERKAFEDGVSWGVNRNTLPSAREAIEAARDAFPLPKMTRPRIVTERGTGFQYTVVVDQSIGEAGAFGKIAMRYRSDQSFLTGFPPSMSVTRERAEMWADLLANPTEEVEASR